ncbi:MAG: hypothetical protein IPI67_06910 [Myxococcales bacterium]|nr:hypothetical protein [Myxococcales bacterium]
MKRTGLSVVVALGLFACQRESRAPGPAASVGQGDPQQIASSELPPSPPVPATGAGPSQLPGTAMGDVAVLVQSASRKMMHDDGKGCLEDLDRVKQIDAKLESTLTAIRAQCEMLTGNCQAGKLALLDYYVREMNMSPGLAKTSVEAIASMRCRGGDETDRDRLLRALRELTDGAYMNTRNDCAANVKLVKELLPRVPSTGPDDSQVTSAPKALFHTGASCLARAGDCKAAFQVYRDEFPSAMEKLSEKDRRSVVEKSFRSGIERCKDAAL